MKKILILCTGNSCRSQIAHGFLDHLTNNSVSVFSAGIEKHGLNKNAVKCMTEIGLDISDYNSNHIDEYINESFDFIITVCDNANETCPVFQDRSAKKNSQKL
jgi:arsenate reductase